MVLCSWLTGSSPPQAHKTTKMKMSSTVACSIVYAPSFSDFTITNSLLTYKNGKDNLQKKEPELQKGNGQSSEMGHCTHSSTLLSKPAHKNWKGNSWVSLLYCLSLLNIKIEHYCQHLLISLIYICHYLLILHSNDYVADGENMKYPTVF